MSEIFPKINEASKHAARRYLIIVGVLPVLLVAFIVGCMLRLSDIGTTPHASANTKSLRYFDIQQQDIAEKINGNRIILVGGSSVLYSVRAKILQSTLGVPVVNYGLQAGLGLDYLLYRARQTLHAGDTAVLFLEYSHYVSVGRQWSAADYVLPHDLTYFLSLPYKDQLDLLGKLTPTEYGTRILDAVMGRSVVDGRANASVIDGNGDLVANKLSAQTPVQKKQLDSILPMKGVSLQSENAKLISAFVNWCRHNGVTVVVGYPAFLNFPEYSQGAEKGFFQSLNQFYRSINVPTLGEPSDFMFPKTMFFDTEYHLHDLAAVTMSDIVGKKLELLLGKGADPISFAYRLRRQLGDNVAQPILFALNSPLLPDEIVALNGFAEPEEWGRWTAAKEVEIKFAAPLPNHFRLDIKVEHVFGKNSTSPILVRIGKQERAFSVTAPGSISLDLYSDGKSNSLKMVLPKPQSPKELGLSNDQRLLGLGFSQIEIIPLADGGTNKVVTKSRLHK